MKITRTIFTKTLTLAFVFASLAGCSNKDDKYFVSTDVAELQLSSEVREVSFCVVSSGEWTIEADNLEIYYGGNCKGADWYVVRPGGGLGGDTVTVLLHNNITFVEKSTTLNIVGKYNTKSLTLTLSSIKN